MKPQKHAMPTNPYQKAISDDDLIESTLRVEVRFKNARLYNAIASRHVITSTTAQGAGAQRARPIKSFCDMHDLPVNTVYALLNLREGPLTKSREVRVICQKLANLLEQDVAWLFSAELYQIKWPRYLAVETSASRFVSLTKHRHEFLLPPTQEEDQSQRELREKIAAVLQTLTPRQEKIIRKRFGFDDGDEQTLKEIGVTLGVTGTRVRNIEIDALRKLRHSYRSQVIRPYYEPD